MGIFILFVNILRSLVRVKWDCFRDFV